MIPLSKRSRKKVLGDRRSAVVQDFSVVVQAFRYADDEKCLLAEFTIGHPFVDDNEPSAHGVVRWDGCMHWDDGGGTMNHFCGVEHLVGWAEAMRMVWVLAREVIDADFGEPEPLEETVRRLSDRNALPTCKSEPGSMTAGTKSTTEAPTATRRLPGRESAR